MVKSVRVSKVIWWFPPLPPSHPSIFRLALDFGWKSLVQLYAYSWSRNCLIFALLHFMKIHLNSLNPWNENAITAFLCIFIVKLIYFPKSNSMLSLSLVFLCSISFRWPRQLTAPFRKNEKKERRPRPEWQDFAWNLSNERNEFFFVVVVGTTLNYPT